MAYGLAVGVCTDPGGVMLGDLTEPVVRPAWKFVPALSLKPAWLESRDWKMNIRILPAAMAYWSVLAQVQEEARDAR